MRKIFKPFIAFSLAGAFFTFSVLCCCTASALMALVHKTAMCSDCQKQATHGPSSNSSQECQRQLISADFIQTHTIAAPHLSKSLVTSFNFLDQYRTSATPLLGLAFPPGGPPPGISLIPLYLRTFNLRI